MSLSEWSTLCKHQRPCLTSFCGAMTTILTPLCSVFQSPSLTESANRIQEPCGSLHTYQNQKHFHPKRKNSNKKSTLRAPLVLVNHNHHKVKTYKSFWICKCHKLHPSPWAHFGCILYLHVVTLWYFCSWLKLCLLLLYQDDSSLRAEANQFKQKMVFCKLLGKLKISEMPW